MTNSQPASSCRVISIATARAGAAVQSHSGLALICGQRVINLSELAQFIRSDCRLSYLVTEAACQELGFPWLSIEEAVVLLGSEGLYSLLLRPPRHGRSASRLRRTLHGNSITPPANFSPLESFQEEPE